MVSIIVPIYNKEKELKQCIESVINQTYTNLEIILVNDGSKDLSREICEKFLKSDSRIKLINKKNEGVELARVTGLKYATGDYVTFVDSDDWLSNDAIELLVNAIEKENADVSFGNYYRVLDRYGIIKKCIHADIYNNLIITKDQFMKKYYDSFCGGGIFPINMWGKLYRKSLIKSVEYRTIGISHGEDLCFNLQVLPYAKKIVSIPQNIYFYRWGGMTNNINKNLFKDACKAYNFKMLMFAQHNSIESYGKASAELCNFFITYIDTYLKFTKLNELEIKNIISKEIRNENLQKAVRIPTYKWFLDNELYKSIKSQDVNAFFDIQKKGLKKRKLKSSIMKIISRVLT